MTPAAIAALRTALAQALHARTEPSARDLIRAIHQRERRWKLTLRLQETLGLPMRVDSTELRQHAADLRRLGHLGIIASPSPTYQRAMASQKDEGTGNDAVA